MTMKIFIRQNLSSGVSLKKLYNMKAASAKTLQKYNMGKIMEVHIKT